MPPRNGFTLIPGAIVGLPPDSVGSTELSAGAVTAAKLGVGAVTSGAILDGTIQNADVGDGALQGTKLAVGSVPWDRLAPGTIDPSLLPPILGVDNADVTGTIDGAKIAGNVPTIIRFNGVDLPAHTFLNFVGNALDVAPDAGDDEVVVNILGSGNQVAGKGTNANVASLTRSTTNAIGASDLYAGAAHTHVVDLAPLVLAVALATLTGQLVVNTAAATPSLVVSEYVTSASGALRLHGATAVAGPHSHGATNLGTASVAWGTLFAVTGTIQASSEETKEDVQPLDPAAALAAILATPPVRFSYKAPTSAPAPRRDPRQRFDMRARREALLDAPRLRAARVQHGFIAEQADPLFLTGPGQTTPSNSVGVLLGGMHELAAQVAALKGA